MLLLIDIGNSNITFGIADSTEILKTRRINTELPEEAVAFCIESLDDLLDPIEAPVVEGAVLCSVVAEVSPVVTEAVKKRLHIMPLFVGPEMKTGLQFDIHNPQTLGADRIANAVAAYHMYAGKDLIIIDFGTATTFCTITKDGKYTGGAIMQGLGISAESLHEKTSGLPLVDLKAPVNIPAKDTTDNIITGIILGHAGAVDRIVSDISKATDRTYTVIATGGYAPLLSPHIKTVHYVQPSLTLEGLRILYRLNC